MGKSSFGEVIGGFMELTVTGKLWRWPEFFMGETEWEVTVIVSISKWRLV